MSRPHRQPARPVRRRGFTLVEVMISIFITGLVGTAVSAMLIAVAQGTTVDAGMRSVNVKHKVVSARMDAAIRSSMMVLAEGTDFLVLWMADSCQNGQPNLSEIRRIQWDTSTEELRCYRAPPGLSPIDDTLYDVADDFGTITWDLIDTVWFIDELWGTRVTGWSHTLDVQHASLVRYSLTIAGDGVTRTGAHTAALRSRP